MMSANKLPLIIYCLFAVLLVSYAALKPYHDWDMLAYVASAKKLSGASELDAHRYVYNNLAEYTDQATYDRLTNNNEGFDGGENTKAYREVMLEDHKLFAQQLPFYEIRIIYNKAIAIVHKLGVNAFSAVHYVSLLAMSLSLLIIARIVFSLGDDKLFAVVPLLLFPFSFVDVGRVATPDALAACATFALALSFYRKHFYMVFVLMPILVAVRTDLVILPVVLGLYFLLMNRRYLLPYIVSMGVTAGLYLWINHFFGNYGWHTIFHVTLIERVVNPGTAELVVTPALYLSAFVSGIKSAVNYQFIVYGLCCLLLLAFHLKNKELFLASKSFNLSVFHYLSLIYVILHFLAFPVVYNRFFVAQYAIAIILVLELICRHRIEVLTLFKRS